MAGSLRSRLSRLRESALVQPGTQARAQPRMLEPPLPPFLQGWEDLGEGVFGQRSLHPGLLPDEIDIAPFVLDFARLGRRAHGRGSDIPMGSPTVETSRFRFFDLETTGLSGGAGTIAFLATVGRTAGPDFRLDQFFLSDYPGEKRFVAAVLDALGPEPLLASYNGKAFDWPLLRNRCVMNGLGVPAPSLHVDLLLTARRLWKSLHDGASLSLIESAVLGITRPKDVPGSLIPQIWFEFLAQGDHELMPTVLSHNAEDVIGVMAIMARAAKLFAAPLDRDSVESVDILRMGRILGGLGRLSEAETLLGLGAERGDGHAAFALAVLLRRQGRAREARQALGKAERSYSTAMEGARLAERIEGDLAAALEAASMAARLATREEERQKALSRVRRLELRIAAASRGRPGRRRS